jgi:hypothetical protein
MKRLGFLTMAVVGALALGACGTGNGDGNVSDGGDGGGASPTTSAAPAPSEGPGGTGGGATPKPGDGSGVWTTGPLAVTHDVAVPPVPVLLGIRSAAHPDDGYDRIVFDFTGPLPGYTVRYVNEVREDASDRPVTVPGRRFLLIAFTPAQAHTDAGGATITPRGKTLDYPMMRGYVIVGDFEGHVSVAVGLDDVVGFRVGELPGSPGRIYLDVAA